MINVTLAISLHAAALQTAPSETALQPDGPWIVQAEESLCFLSRNFGAGAEKLKVGFQQLFGGSGQIHIWSKAEGKRSGQGAAKIRFHPSNIEIEGSFYTVFSPNGQRMTRISLPREAFDAVKKSDEISFDAKPLSVRIRLGQSTKAMAAYDSCEDGLMRAWGVDPNAVSSERAARVKGNPAALFSRSGYPPEAVANGHIGLVYAALKINADGTVGACNIAAGAGKTLNDATCRQAVKIRFDPATDAGGQPIPSIYVLPVRWML